MGKPVRWSGIAGAHFALRFQVRDAKTAYRQIAGRSRQNARHRPDYGHYGFDRGRQVADRLGLFLDVGGESAEGTGQALDLVRFRRSLSGARRPLSEIESAPARVRKFRAAVGEICPRRKNHTFKRSDTAIERIAGDESRPGSSRLFE